MDMCACMGSFAFSTYHFWCVCISECVLYYTTFSTFILWIITKNVLCVYFYAFFSPFIHFRCVVSMNPFGMEHLRFTFITFWQRDKKLECSKCVFYCFIFLGFLVWLVFVSEQECVRTTHEKSLMCVCVLFVINFVTLFIASSLSLCAVVVNYLNLSRCPILKPGYLSTVALHLRRLPLLYRFFVPLSFRPMPKSLPLFSFQSARACAATNKTKQMPQAPINTL